MTVRSNINKFHKDFQGDKDMQKDQLYSVFKEHENMLVMNYRGAKDKTAGKQKIVHVVLTKYSGRMVNMSKVDGQGNIVKKPEAIVFYNTNMEGIDRMDQQLHVIQVLKKTYKWSQKIFLPHFVVTAQ